LHPSLRLPQGRAQEDVHRQLVRKVDDPRSIDAAPDLPRE
jgi:hypothetical protein